MEIREVKGFLERLNNDNISFDRHFYKRLGERPINEGMVRSFILQTSKLEKIELGKEKSRFKLWFKMSNKYSLVVIIEAYEESKGLKIISSLNTYIKFQ